MNIQIDKLLTNWLTEDSIKSNQTPHLVDYEEPLDDFNNIVFDNMGSRDQEEINSNSATDHEEGLFQKDDIIKEEDDNTEDHEEDDNAEDHEENVNTEDHEDNDGNEDQEDDGGKEDWEEYIPGPEDGNEGLAENEEDLVEEDVEFAGENSS